MYVTDHGQGTLEDNDIAANALAGVEYHEGGANPILRRQQHPRRNANVAYPWYGQRPGTLEDNDIAANTSAGLAITMAATRPLRRNPIHDGKQNGILHP